MSIAVSFNKIHFSFYIYYNKILNVSVTHVCVCVCVCVCVYMLLLFHNFPCISSSTMTNSAKRCLVQLRFIFEYLESCKVNSCLHVRCMQTILLNNVLITKHKFFS